MENLILPENEVIENPGTINSDVSEAEEVSMELINSKLDYIYSPITK